MQPVNVVNLSNTKD